MKSRGEAAYRLKYPVNFKQHRIIRKPHHPQPEALQKRLSDRIFRCGILVNSAINLNH